MKNTITSILLLLVALSFAQGGALADLKFEEAETAFSNNDYKTLLPN